MDIKEIKNLKNFCGKDKSLYFITKGLQNYPLTDNGRLLFDFTDKHKGILHYFCARISLSKIKKGVVPCLIALTNSVNRTGNSYVVNEDGLFDILDICGIQKSDLDLNSDVYHLPYGLIGKVESKKEKARKKREKDAIHSMDNAVPSSKESDSLLSWIKNTKPVTTKYEDLAYDKFNRFFNGSVVKQVPFLIGGKAYFADLCIKSRKTIIEIDGSYHDTEEQREKDRNRDKAFASIGYQTIRIPNEKVKDQKYINGIIEMMLGGDVAVDTTKFSLTEIQNYVSLHKRVAAPAEYIYNYWNKKKWKTKKGVDITTHSISIAVGVANGVYCQKFIRKKEKKNKIKNK